MIRDGRIDIRHEVVKVQHGWLVSVTRNGRPLYPHVPVYGPAGVSAMGRQEAEAFALAEARGEAARYRGDWDITINGEPSGDSGEFATPTPGKLP